MSHHREILAALHKLKSGSVQLSSDQYLAVLEAIEQASEALHVAPRGSDPVANGIWWNHERTPALARLADALTPHQTPQLRATDAKLAQSSDAQVVRALHQSLLDNATR